MTSVRRTSVLAFAVLSIIAAGCGDSEEKNDYVDQVNELQVAYVDDMNALVSDAPATDPDASAQLAADMAELTQALADDTAAVTPPEEVTELHDQLVRTLEDVSTQITDAGDTIANGNPQQAAAAASELQTATAEAQTELRSIIDQINSELQN